MLSRRSGRDQSVISGVSSSARSTPQLWYAQLLIWARWTVLMKDGRYRQGGWLQLSEKPGAVREVRINNNYNKYNRRASKELNTILICNESYIDVFLIIENFAI
jgi:hypothetical protein